LERDREAVRYHYNVSNDFFRLFLGPTMVYSCAYFEREDATLDEAQTAKLDLVCRKLRLRPGERFLDIGCGWGSLVMHAARHYGVQATGITLSEKQAELAQRRIKEAGLEDRARVEIADYRELRGSFDKIASVGMVEHVGAAKLPAYFASAHRILAPGGVFLNHGITAVGETTSPRRRTFIAKYVFPDGELVPIERMLAEAERAGFETRDVEDLREHYARTLRHWVRNLESRRDEALRHVSEETFRVWRLYMSGSAGSFAAGRIRIYQSLLSKPLPNGDSRLPLTRADWYA
jgi:cyclopropane-fatty-acyl-phospholipid synthase